jgi:CheY-like chemotaxis protein
MLLGGEGSMGESVETDRRCSLRVPVRGFAVLQAVSGTGPMHGSIENLSRTGALVNVSTRPPIDHLDMELRLSEGDGWITARTVRVERVGLGLFAHARHAKQRSRWRIAVVFDRVPPNMRDAIQSAIDHALCAAKRRPILVIDSKTERRTSLVTRLESEGMMPLAPKTQREAIDLLTSAQLHVSVCMLAPGFGVERGDLATMLADRFPWVTTAEIDDDVDATATRAIAAWAATPVARLGVSIA